MAIDFNYIKEHVEEYCIENVCILGAANEGLALNICLSSETDIVDFAEELGRYFFHLDNPKFGQKYVNEMTRNYIYDWLTQILNTGNYEEIENGIILELNLYMDFEELNTFRYAIKEYKNKYKKDIKDKNNLEKDLLLAEKTAINILDIIEKVRLTTIEEN